MATLTFNEKNKFVNPYNFVSKTDNVDRKPFIKGNKTGVIHCELIVKDCIAIPDRSDLPNSGHDFYNVNGKYIIPGSSIRGCIRSVFEAVTPSCFSVVNANLLSQRKPNPDGNRVPGLLMKQNGSWIIYEANYKRGKYKFKEYENGSHCDFAREWFKLGKDLAINKTYFYAKLDSEGQWVSSEAECSDDDINKILDIFDSYYEGIKTNADSTAGKLRGIIRGFQSDLRKMQSESNSDLIVPVFYELYKNRLTYLSPAQTGRVAFHETVKTLLHDHAPCKGEKREYCPACRLFGTLGDNHPIASRVRFSDATLVRDSFNI
ncbi:MAG: RAMP superfamily CRISPR-associated protein, partial [Acutalibacteraceae bacterium]